MIDNVATGDYPERLKGTNEFIHALRLEGPILYSLAHRYGILQWLLPNDYGTIASA